MKQRKGLGIGKGQGYKNIIPQYDSYVHSLSARGVKSCTKMQKLKAMGDLKSYIIDKDYTVVVWAEDTRTGFRHLAKLMYKGREIESSKAVYYNRTWESYPFQTVIHDVIRKHFDEKEAQEKINLLEKKKSMYAKGKKNPVNKDNLVNYIMDYEGGDPTVEDVVNLFSYLVKTGQAWSLQGMYGRQAQRLIEAGILDKKGNIDWSKINKAKEKYYGLNAKRDLLAEIRKPNRKVDGDLLRLMKRRLNDNKITQSMIFLDGEQTYVVDKDLEKQGYEYLKDQWKTPTGQERKNNPFGYREENILKDFDHFELREFYDTASGYAQQQGIHYYQPIWTVVSKSGDSFDYYWTGDGIKIIG